MDYLAPPPPMPVDTTGLKYEKTNLARGQIPFEYPNGAEGGTRTPAGFPTIPLRGRCLRGGCVSFRLAITMADEHLQVSFLSFSWLLFPSRKARRSPAVSSSLIHCS